LGVVIVVVGGGGAVCRVGVVERVVSGALTEGRGG
jgi:hypothetical protein